MKGICRKLLLDPSVTFSRLNFFSCLHRPLRGLSSSSSIKNPIDGTLLPGLYHAGVVVLVEDGEDRERWLIHKGENYGKKSDTVITHASYMSSK